MDSDESKQPAIDENAVSPDGELQRIHEMKIWKAKWNKKEYAVYFDHLTTVRDLKEQLEDETNVRQEKIKLVGLALKKEHSGQKMADDTFVQHLQCKSKKGFIMIGTLEKNAFRDHDVLHNSSVPFVLDDECISGDGSLNDSIDVQQQQVVEHQQERLEKLDKVIASTSINKIFEPRKGKKLLVLDIDYTIFDMGSKTESWATLKRPFTEYLMQNCYPHYDIVVWSQTSWRWIEIKLTEMNMLTNEKYKIMFVLDKKAMFTVKSNFKNGTKKHYVKPLQLIWSKFKGVYHEHNTIHIDDLSRNFALNQGQGLTIKPYKDAYLNQHTDRELLHLTHYLTLIAKKESFQGLNHNQWKEYLEKHGQQFANLN